MPACTDDPETARTRARALRWTLLAVVAETIVTGAIAALDPAGATGVLWSALRMAASMLLTGAPIAVGGVLLVLAVWRVWFRPD